MFIQLIDAALNVNAIVDVYESCVWNTDYFTPGDFQIIFPATSDNFIKVGSNQYVMISNDQENVGVIESVSYSVNDKRMTVAGRFAKSILDRRLILDLSESLLSGQDRITLNPVIVGGATKTLEEEVRSLVNAHISNGSSATVPNRRVNLIVLGQLKGYRQKITDSAGNAEPRQTTYSNLLTYTDELLEEFGFGALLKLSVSGSTRRLAYEVINGANRTWGNSDGNEPVIFSIGFDNLSEYQRQINTANHKNTYIAGGSGEGADRFFVSDNFSSGNSGLNRREIFVDALDQSITYFEGDTEHTYTDSEYAALVRQKANAELIEGHSVINEADAKITINGSSFVYKRDFSVGDIVTVIDPITEELHEMRVVRVTEVWDRDGYSAYANLKNSSV